MPVSDSVQFAGLWPHRVASLTVISATRGGWDTLPRSLRAWKYVLRLARDNTPSTRATTDLKMHFTKKSLQKCVQDASLRLLRAFYIVRTSFFAEYCTPTVTCCGNIAC
jgi:hypothetical protein